ncbi:hypothetical protein [Cellulomonas sp. Marseille-Q8402]
MLTPEEEVEREERRDAAIRRNPAVRKSMAQFRVAADEGVGRETPQWIRDLAEKPLVPRRR